MRGGYFHYALGERLAAVLPKQALLRLAQGLAKVYASSFSPDLGALTENMRRALPPSASEREITESAKKVIYNFTSYLVDFFYTQELSLDFIKKNVETHGLEKLDTALQRGKGVVIASAHLGNWEMGGMTIAKMGYPVYGIALKHKVSKIDSLFQRRRDESGLKIIFMGHSLRSCFRVLKENRILALNADRLFGEAGVSVNFMNREVSFPKGIWRLSQTTGAQVLPCFFVMRGFNRYVLEVQSPLEPSSEEGMIQQFASRLEEKIRQYPTQWFIFQRFWESPEWPI